MRIKSNGFRLATYGVCLLPLTLLAYWLRQDFAGFAPLEGWSMILGYLSFLLIGVTLLLGPMSVWLPPSWKAPLLSARGDVGIIAGLCGLLHVALVLVLFQGEPRLMIIDDSHAPKAEGWLGLFFLSFPHEESLIPNWSRTGVANYLGLCAAAILLTLFLTSFQIVKKRLGGSSWKRLHLGNPLLFLLVIFHALIYIQSIKGEPHSFADFLWFAAIVWIARGVGFLHNVFRRKR
ncbi:ferric reductase-like transmembrane domain-containing protein [Brevibacillus choshinensis]|uniref:ferric reductase-like transmembrane domain-containing protein n=1 Tax=Brevibacillus choshinensis TaxID=54911 RepID=UPI001EED2EDE|nr:ferric reductase-like transmembrane domain-containing protein [Brevibacillus choshinensis]